MIGSLIYQDGDYLEGDYPEETLGMRRKHKPSKMIKIEKLGKSYGDLVALESVSMEVGAGQIHGLLGPNGAGKSTTIGCLSGLVDPTSGSASLAGHDVRTASREAKAVLGVVPQDLALYEDLSAPDNLRYWGAAYGMRGKELRTRVEEVLRQIELADRSKETVKGFSGGMKRRLNFGCAIVHRPKILLLDEPTVGVDPQSRRKLLDLVRELADQGTCVLYTTHYMEEAQELCDSLAVIDHGRLIAEGTMEDLRNQLGGRDLLRLSGAFEARSVETTLSAFEGTEIVKIDEQLLTISMAGASRQLPALFLAFSQAGMEITETTLTQPNLESLFIQLTGRELRE
ncbi:MAG: ABC-2 type transport system ATP-binding protein [Candidatus Paceibacteria bacterium]|jgi:ABC-2 type transport system ATP-binding protein